MKVNTFIVGAPKCGTTAVADIISQHSRAFLADIKEPHYFCTDFPDMRRITDLKVYETILLGEEPKDVIVDASVWSLYSSSAAQNIFNYNPNARIIVLLRDPVTMLPSLHNQLVYSGREDVNNFDRAYSLSSSRRSGSNRPKNCLEVSHLFYDHVCRYGEQLERYSKLFGPDQVFVGSFEQYVSSPGEFSSRIFEFLELDDQEISTTKKNSRRQHRYPKLSHFIMRPPFPLSWIKKTVKKTSFFAANPPFRKLYESLSVPAEKHKVLDETKLKISSDYRKDRELLKTFFADIEEYWQ